jgi:hypothetical protein
MEVGAIRTQSFSPGKAISSQPSLMPRSARRFNFTRRKHSRKGSLGKPNRAPRRRERCSQTLSKRAAPSKEVAGIHRSRRRRRFHRLAIPIIQACRPRTQRSSRTLARFLVSFCRAYSAGPCWRISCSWRYSPGKSIAALPSAKAFLCSSMMPRRRSWCSS